MKKNINYHENPNIILAGPGTGKTFTLVEKIVGLQNDLIDKSIGIIVCTFTKKATDEIQNRISEKIDINNQSILVGDIHQISLKLLKDFLPEKYEKYNVIDDAQQVNFIFQKRNNLNFNDELHKSKQGVWNWARDAQEVFNKFTDRKLDLKSKKNEMSEKLFDISEMYKIYLALLHRENLFDFATIQSTFLKELQSNELLLKNIQDNYSYFFIDEFQDVSDIQYEIFKLLSNKSKFITVVGDDDQSIYGFRGANLNNFINFKTDFSSNKVTEDELKINYRSTSNLVNFFNQVRPSNDIDKYVKEDLVPNEKNMGSLPIFKKFNNDVDEGKFIAEQIDFLVKNNFVSNYNNIAILFDSVKFHSVNILPELHKLGIPFEVIGAGNLFEVDPGLKFLNFLNYILSKEKSDNKLFTKDSFEDISSSDKEILNTININDFNSCTSLTYKIFELFDFIKEFDGLGKDLGLLTSNCVNFDEFSDYYDPFTFYSFLLHLKLSKSYESQKIESDESVKIMTIHQSKGLEFDAVFIASQLERNELKSISNEVDQLFPVDYIQFEENRKLYVGLTRAKKILVVTYSEFLTGKTQARTPKDSIKRIMNICSDKYISNDFISEIEKTNKVNKSETKKISINNKLSFNQISTFQICPLQYKFRFFWNLKTLRFAPMIYGSNLHKIVEIILTKIIDGAEVREMNLSQLIYETWSSPPNINSDVIALNQKIALSQIENLFNKFNFESMKNEIFSIEESFDFIDEGIQINGRFDLVTKKNDKVEIIDFKSGSHNKEQHKKYDNQLKFYSYCFEKKHNIKPYKLSVIYLNDSSKIFSDTNFVNSEIKSNFLNISKKIDNQKFEATPGNHCKDCAFRNNCEFKA